MQQPAPNPQRADVDGQGNIIVQVLGNDNRVDFGRPYLRLTRYLTRRRIDSEVDLLSPYSRSIPLVGRQQEFADLRAWLSSGKPISVRVLVGRAGVSKTRLSLELCEQLFGEGWAAGFVQSSELTRFYAKQNLADWGWGRPTLIVLDYVATHAELLNGWLTELSDSQGHPDRPLRLLLLERHADPASGWWQTVFGRGGFGARALQKLLDPAKPIALPELAATEERRAVITETLEQTESDLRPPAAGIDPAFDHQLHELTWGGEPLFLMMAGLIAKQIGIAKMLSLGRADLTFELADRELNKIANIGRANNVDPNFLIVIAGYITLCGGLATTAIRAVVPEEQAALGIRDAGDPSKVAKALMGALGGAAERADPILPDVIGEAALLRAFATYEDGGNDAVRRAFGHAGRHVVATLIRTAQDFAGAGYEQPLAWVDALGSSVDLDQMMMIGDQFRKTTLALLTQGRELTAGKRLGDILSKRLFEKVPKDVVDEMCKLLTGLQQKTEAVVEPLREAVAIHREQATKAPDAYRPSLAAALNNLSNQLSRDGVHEEALSLAREATDLYRDLAAQAPDAWRPGLAKSLFILAKRLSEANQHEAALGSSKEAVDIYRYLMKASDVYQSDLADALNNLAIYFSNVGQHEFALAPSTENVDLYRELAAKAPETHRPGLARALSNRAVDLSTVGQREAALAPAKEAVDLYHELAANAPDDYRPDLGRALDSLVIRMSDVGQRQNAVGPAREAVSVYRELMAKRSVNQRNSLSDALSRLAGLLSAIGEAEAALAPAQEAVRALVEEFTLIPILHASQMIEMVRNYQNHCGEVGREPDQELIGPIVKLLQGDV